MANDLIVRVLGDSSKFEQTMKSSTSTATAFERTLKRGAVTAEQSANVQVAASLKKDARLREEIQLYRQIASAAQQGSREQIVATNLAERSERQLARSMGVTAGEARGLASSTRSFERNLGSATRGALAGSGIFRSLGRSIVFASGGFLAFGGVSAFLRTSIDAAKEAQVVEAQLAQQFKNNKSSLEPYRVEIDKTTNSLSALSGFQNDELKAALTTILRTQPNVNKGLRDEATAADLARAKRISLAQAGTIIAKVEAGNTTLLRRQGIQVAKNATAEQALAVLRAKVAGQARAGATEQERFGAILHNTEEIIGTGILPTLNKYLASGSLWLQQMDESGKLQRDVSHAAHDFGEAVDTAAGFVKGINKVTGSFKNTLELLLSLKLASWAAGVGGGFFSIGSKAEAAETNASRLNGTLGKLARIGTITIGINLEANASGGAKGALERIFGGTLIGAGVGGAPGALIGTGLGAINAGLHDPGAADFEKAVKFKKDLDAGLLDAADRAFYKRLTGKTLPPNPSATSGLGPHHAAPPATTDTTTTGALGTPLTAKQKNEFFDNAIARILLRGGLGGIQQQIDALVKADQLIAKRISVTKDITRKQNLEDQLLTNQAQIRSLKAEQAVSAQQAAADAHQKLLDALQARAAARNTRQFKALGLTATGDTVAPSVRQLRNALGKFEDTVQGTFLDTSKTESTIARIRKVLSGGLGAVGRDVRLKIQSILSDLNQQLDQSTEGNLTKWKHLSAQAFLSGIPDLSPAQKRLLDERFSTLGPGGAVPGARTQAFALAGGGGGTIKVESTLNVDGEQMAKNTTSHQIKRGRKRTVPRNG